MKTIRYQFAIAAMLVALASAPLAAQTTQPGPVTGVQTSIGDGGPIVTPVSTRKPAEGQYWIRPVQAGQAAQPATAHHAPAPTITMVDCNCHQPSCHTCRPRLRDRIGCNSCGTDCGCVQCPSCEGDICKLELDKSEVTKKCFKVEQVSVCIPPVRFPWQECCPPGTSETRLVTKLKVHKYKCPNCAYKWKLHEPEKAESSESNDAPAKKMDENKVPPAPVVKGAFRPFSRR